jgi:hypothetical protein
VFRVRTVFSGGQGTPYLSTFYFLPTSGKTAQMAVAATGAFWTAVKAHMANTLSFATEPEVVSIDAITGLATGSTAVTQVTGTGTSGGSPIAPATQGLVRWRTGVFTGGREIRGRTFLPGVTTGDNNAGVPIALYKTDINTAAAALIADANSDFCIWSKKHANDPLATSGVVWTQFAVLRSRRD